MTGRPLGRHGDALGAFYCTRHYVVPPHFSVVTLAIVVPIDARLGNSPWRVFLLTLNALRRFTVVPLVASAVPKIVIYDSSNSKDIALNATRFLRCPCLRLTTRPSPLRCPTTSARTSRSTGALRSARRRLAC